MTKSVRVNRFCLAGTALLALLCTPGPIPAAAKKDDKAWDTTQPRGRTRKIEFTTTEGTWMSLDLSPDGRWIVFDLLAHVYRVPAEGGEAQCLTQDSGIALNFMPRFSPDGETIAFVSDRNGQNNLWLMDADGGNPRVVAAEEEFCVIEPTWAPDGRYLIARRQKGGCQRGDPTSALWMFHRDGGEGIELVAPEMRYAGSPSVSPDGKFVYFHVDVCDTFVDDTVNGCYQVRRLDLRTGKIEDVTWGVSSLWERDSNGGAMAPRISPDGRWLAFARKIPDGTITYKGHTFGPRTALWLRNLDSGEETAAMDPIEVDMGENGYFSLQLLPSYSWSADSGSIVLSQGGKLRRLEVATGKVRTLPFSADVRRTLSERVFPPLEISDGPVTVRFMRWMTASPGGETLLFQALGRLWRMELPDGAPARLTPEAFPSMEFSPAWSPDGRWIAFTSWSEKERGQVWKIPAGGGEPVRLSREAGEYLHPTWSPDGRDLVVARAPIAAVRSHSWVQNPRYELVRIPAAGGDAGIIASVKNTGRWRHMVRPSFGPEGRLFYPEPLPAPGPDDGEATQLVSSRLDGSDRLVHLVFPYADEVVPSPDGKWVGFQEGDNVYVMPFPWMGEGGKPTRVDKLKGKYPVKQLSKPGGLNPRWRNDETLEFGSGNRYFAYSVKTAKTAETLIRLTAPRALPEGSIALSGAKIVTLDDDAIIDSGIVLVQGGRIACVGECDASTADRVVDVSGKTIIPGFIDMHTHQTADFQGIIPAQNYEMAPYLAYGVTTALDPSVWSDILFPTAEMIETGQIAGPRLFTTGEVVFRSATSRTNEISSYEIAEQTVDRLVSWGAVSIKQYLQPRRDRRQWVVEAARGKGVKVTGEFADLEYNLGMVMDGQAGWEHDLMVLPIYSDVARFLGKAEVIYSPTFITTQSGMIQEEYFYQESEVWKDSKLRRWLPWTKLIPQARRRTLRPVTDYTFPIIAQGAADIIAEGGTTVIGSHGQLHGIGSHWEVWIAATAMGPHRALEVASVHGAHALGADKDLGTITPGKLADLMVLNSNPLDDIRNTTDILYVMKGGTLYDAGTLDEIWPQRKPYGEPYWIDPAALRSDDRPLDYWDRRR